MRNLQLVRSGDEFRAVPIAGRLFYREEIREQGDAEYEPARPVRRFLEIHTRWKRINGVGIDIQYTGLALVSYQDSWTEEPYDIPKEPSLRFPFTEFLDVPLVLLNKVALNFFV